ncbi:coiled-coil domain-containing protein 107 [Dromaius novaehollandiae]|uniref:coiled-coil domain-containing protein 107 n=1 Tax=Dromaius novaehollandiae TaxID=8790 RepID=UPI00311FFB5C
MQNIFPSLVPVLFLFRTAGGRVQHRLPGLHSGAAQRRPARPSTSPVTGNDAGKRGPGKLTASSSQSGPAGCGEGAEFTRARGAAAALPPRWVSCVATSAARPRCFPAQPPQGEPWCRRRRSGRLSSRPPPVVVRKAAAAAMALSVAQQVLVSAVLVLCVLVVMPRMFGAGGGRAGSSVRGGQADPRPHRRGSPQAIHQARPNPGYSEGRTYQGIQQMRNAMEKEIKSERTRGNGRDLAFTLMPLYALGVGVFAAYKFLKMKSQEESLSKKEKNTEDKAKETEHQLLELEQHLAQTEKMLNSLLTQLDPLSNCVNALACEQKDEIMTQLQSIRRLMKESGLDKSENKMKDVSHICNEKLEDLIQSFAEHSPEKEIDDQEDSNEDLLEHVDNDYKIEEDQLYEECDVNQVFEPDVVEDQEMINKDVLEPEETGLRRRNRNE